jgi:hypothetical protein
MRRLGADAGDAEQFEQPIERGVDIGIDMRQNFFHRPKP